MHKGHSISKEEFIQRSNKIHKNKYDYSKVEFRVVRDMIQIICPIHGLFNQKVMYHLGGSGCLKCSKERGAKKQRTSIENIISKSVEKYSETFEFDISSYRSFYKKMRIKCKEHGWQEMSPDFHLNSEKGCKECNSMKLKFEEFLKRAKNIHGDRYDYCKSKDNYDGAISPIIITCSIHGDFEMTPRQHYKGHGCHKCANEKISSKNTYSLQEFITKSRAKHENKYDYSKSIYVKKNADILITCPVHGDFWQRAENHWNGAGCPKCSCIGKSKDEKEVLTFIKQIYSGIIEENVRKLVDGYELDVFIPELNLAIEYDGLYWHSEDKKGKMYHFDKTVASEKKQITLLHIFSNEWSLKKDIWKSMIKNRFQTCDERIYARKCELKSISSKESKEFLNNNHIQGNIPASIRYGLFYNNELVSIMTFGKSRFNKNYQYELLRSCTKKNYIIVGGVSKLFSYFVKQHNPSSIISYCDRRYANGKMYNNLKFKLKKISKPNYWYTKNNLEILSRISFQKHKLKDKLETFDNSLSEWDNMKNNGWNRIWDCGNFVFEWYKS